MKLNGHLELNALGLSVIKNAILDRQTSVPAFDAAEAGRVIYNATTGKYHYNNGTSWQILATAAEISSAGAELDHVETALGEMIDGATGNFVAGAFSTFNKVSNPTSVLNVLSQLDASIQGHDQFAELEDVTFTNLVDAQFPKYDAAARGGLGDWVNHTLVLTDISDVTTTVAELNELHNAGLIAADFIKLQSITASATEINQLTTSGVTNDDLVKLHAVTSTATELNLLSTTTVTTLDLNKLHDITATAAEINYAVGVNSNLQTQLDNKQPLDADLTTIAGFEPATDSSETLTINATSITHAGQNDIMVATGGVEGSRWTLKRGAAARTSLGLGNIAVMDESSFIRGDVAVSNVARDVSWNAYKIVNLAAGTEATDAINLGQLQAAQGGMTWKQEADFATTANITLSGEQAVDGATVATEGMVVLVKDQTVASENGLYVVSAAGAWTRTTDMDTGSEANKATVFVKSGDAWGVTQWTVNSTVATIGADAINFVQTNALSGVTAGIGLSKDGNTMNINLGAGIVALPDDEVGIDLYDALTSALILSTDGTARSEDTGAKLHLLLDLAGNGKLIQSAAGLKVDTNTITEAELTASVAGAGLTGGNGTALAVVSAAGTAAAGGDDVANWAGVGAITVTADAVGVTLGSTSTSAAPGNHVHKADVITFDNSATSLTGSPANVQAAIVAIDTTLDDVFADLANVKTAAGFDAVTGEFVQHTTASLASVNAATTVFEVDEALSTAITSNNTAISDRVTNSYHRYDAANAALVHTITHTTGQKFNNVTVIDVTDSTSATFDSVVIPESIKFNSASELVVTFNEAVKCIVVIMGIA
jgi:hypothetical protein